MAPPAEAWANDPIIQDIDRQLERDEEYLGIIEDQDLYEANLIDEEGELEECDREEGEILFAPEEEEFEEKDKDPEVKWADVLLLVENELAKKNVKELNLILGALNSLKYIVDADILLAVKNMIFNARTGINKNLPGELAKVIKLNNYRPPAPRNPVKEKIIRALILGKIAKKKRPQLRLVLSNVVT